MDIVFLVGIGGFLGTVSRYLVGRYISLIFPSEIPLSTVAINLIGSFLIGAVIATIDSKSHPRTFYFIVTGILGGFTTFSAFSAETISLVEKELYLPALIYVFLTLIGGLLLCLVGRQFIVFFMKG